MQVNVQGPEMGMHACTLSTIEWHWRHLVCLLVVAHEAHMLCHVETTWRVLCNQVEFNTQGS